MEPEQHERMCSTLEGAVLAELAALRQRVAELETDAAERERLRAQVQQECCSVRTLAAEAQQRQGPLHSDVPVCAILDAIVDPIIIMDATGLPVRANRAAIAACGLDPTGVELEVLVERLSVRQPDGRTLPDEELPISRALRGEPVRDQAWMLTSASGQDLHVLVSVSPLVEQDQVSGMIAILHDITEIKQMEKALCDSEHKFRGVIDRSADGIVLADEQGAIEDWNQAQEQITGLSRSQAIGRPVWDMLFQTMPEEQKAPAVYEDLRTNTIEFLKTGQAPWLNQLCEREVQRPDGTRRYVQAMMFSLEKDKGFMSGSITRDITEYRHAQEALSKREQEMRAIADNIPGLISYVGPDGCHRFANSRYEEWFGMPRSEVIGKHHREILGAATYERVRGYIQAALSGQRVHYEDRLPHVSGDVRWVSADYVPDIDEHGSVKGFFALVTDISDRKRAQEEQERLVKQVCAAQEELRELARHLQAAREEERARVARELHDEFGQALTALKMDLAWIDGRLEPGQTKLREKARAMSDLLTSTLHTVQRVVAELRPGLLDDLGLTAALEWQTQEFTERTGVACQVDLGEGDISLGRDLDTALFRICQETLTNIARHAEATQVDITLCVDPDSVLLIIRDNGKGISEDQISDPRSLGLTGIRERARTWGGEATFEGVPGNGTTVHVLIPRQSVSRPGERT